ncbi:hypothetical protein Tco_0272998 [Tanacetum coccineum]
MAMDRRRHGNRADAQLVLILEDKPDTIPYKQDQTLTLTPEFGPGVTPGARLTRVPQCAGIIPRTCRNTLQSPEQEFTSTPTTTSQEVDIPMRLTIILMSSKCY